MLPLPARFPKNEFSPPVVFALPVLLPKKALKPPIVLELPALVPKKALPSPVVLFRPALKPKSELEKPVLAWPAPTPANKLEDPASLNTREPPRLNCFAASKVSALPSPLMLKLLDACWLVAFWM